MTMAALLVEARRLCSVAGLSPEVCTDSLLEAAVSRRGKALGLQPEAFLSRLRDDTSEQRELVEELLVRESWFWRDVRPFEWFSGWLREQGWPARGTLRVLSAPCANGEEAYSIVLAALRIGVKASAIHVDGLDLSLRGLGLARAARYSPRALRALPDELKSRYFVGLPDGGFQLDQACQSAVRFECANLAEAGRVARGAPYDAIFCRNLLIYLDAPTRSRLLAEILQGLTPDGALILGHAEASLAQSLPLSPVKDGACFAFLRQAPAGVAGPIRPAPVRAAGGPLRRAGLPVRPRSTAGVASSLRQAGASEAQALADAGRYREALELAESLRVLQPGVAEHEYLVGLLHSALGHPAEARRAYQRALYLEPSHGPSREQLSLLLEADGDTARAARMRQGLRDREDIR